MIWEYWKNKWQNNAKEGLAYEIERKTFTRKREFRVKLVG
jgi:hypothetical protein